MINWYDLYCSDNRIVYGKDSQRKARKLERRINRASRLSEVDLSAFSTREEAEHHLNKSAYNMFGPIGLLILSEILSWLIRKLLDMRFNE